MRPPGHVRTDPDDRPVEMARRPQRSRLARLHRSHQETPRRDARAVQGQRKPGRPARRREGPQARQAAETETTLRRPAHRRDAHLHLRHGQRRRHLRPAPGPRRARPHAALEARSARIGRGRAGRRRLPGSRDHSSACGGDRSRARSGARPRNPRRACPRDLPRMRHVPGHDLHSWRHLPDGCAGRGTRPQCLGRPPAQGRHGALRDQPDRGHL